jgi:SAM-dependent methyltransferase/uncharacterized protein YbaR (Trm112 family)
VETLACPLTGLGLCEYRLDEAEDLVGRLSPRAGPRTPVGPTATVLVREDGAAAYPVVNGFPVLLAPEVLRPASGGPFEVDLADPRYAEAYVEMDFYNAAAANVAPGAGSSSQLRLDRLASLSPEQRQAFPDPAELWLDSAYESTAQWEAYHHLSPLGGARALQIGGKGEQAVMFLLAGAAEAWVVSPMVGELAYARTLAQRFGMNDRLRCAAGVAEELPLASATIDRIWAKSLHHTVAQLAYPECARVLRDGGRLAAVEPWRAALHDLGTRILGKRERGVHCRPLDYHRVAPFLEAFPDGRVVRHGPFLRYPMLALERFGLKLDVARALPLARLDDRLGSLVPGRHRPGSCAALLGGPSAIQDRVPPSRSLSQ